MARQPPRQQRRSASTGGRGKGKEGRGGGRLWVEGERREEEGMFEGTVSERLEVGVGLTWIPTLVESKQVTETVRAPHRTGLGRSICTSSNLSA